MPTRTLGIVIDGATGRLGKHVVDQLSARGAQVRAMSRHEQPRSPRAGSWR